MSDNENSNHSGNDPQADKPGKVLPFRRPGPQPTLPRRTSAASGSSLRGKGKANSSQVNSWKGKAFQALQFALLAAAILLALKNCGKI
jgi:hypothetical protein